MRIKVCLANADAITAELEEAQRKAKTRKISVTEIMDFLEMEEKRLHIPKKYMDGVRVTVDLNAQQFPNCYRGIPESTHFCAEYKRGNWYLTNLYRDRCCRPTVAGTVFLPEETKAAIISNMQSISMW